MKERHMLHHERLGELVYIKGPPDQSLLVWYYGGF